jgi:pimeloyl-ACP methyl ester carboxylesterase
VLIEQLGLAPAWMAGNSSGASIALRLAAERPDLFLGLMTHEPPFFSLLADDPSVAPMLEEVAQRIGTVVERIAAGDHAGAAEQFVESVALGPGFNYRPSFRRHLRETHRRSWMKQTIQSTLASTSKGSRVFPGRRYSLLATRVHPPPPP